MYATPTQLYAYLDQVAVTDATTALLADILTRASAKVDRHIGAVIGDPLFRFVAFGTATTKIVAAYGGLALALPPHSIGSVTLVEYEATTNPVAWATVADAWEEQPTGVLYRSYGWGTPYGVAPLRYRITASWGYGLVPADIENITLELAVNMHRSKTKGGFTELIGAEGGASMRVVSGFTKEHLVTLDDWATILRGVAV